MPDPQALKALVAVADAGSLNAASRQLAITQQAMSARIISAEARAGVALVARTPRGSTLTPEGIVIAEWAARADSRQRTGRRLAASRHDKQARLGSAPALTIAEQLLPGWLVSFRARASRGRRRRRSSPHCRQQRTVAAQVRRGAADIGLVEGPASPKGLKEPPSSAMTSSSSSSVPTPMGTTPPSPQSRRTHGGLAGQQGGRLRHPQRPHHRHLGSPATRRDLHAGLARRRPPRRSALPVLAGPARRAQRSPK